MLKILRYGVNLQAQSTSNATHSSCIHGLEEFHENSTKCHAIFAQSTDFGGTNYSTAMRPYVLQRLRYKDQRKPGGPRHCPNCCKPITGDLQTNFALKTMVAKVLTQCSRCRRKDELETLLKHDCPEEEITCSNEGCSLKIKRKDKEMHAEDCLYRVIQCSLCHHRTTLMDREIHVDYCCPEGKTTCPFKCKLRVKRYDHNLGGQKI